MTGAEIGLISVVALLFLIYIGMQVGVALMLVSFVCVAIMKSPDIALRMMGGAGSDAIREYLYGVIPLFILMGMLVTISGVGRDTFDVIGHLFRKIKAGLGVATVGANAVFASITGVSLASATVFTKVAVPELERNGYRMRFSLGIVAGSSVLGMLIPPSLLMIVYGVLAEESVGKMFIAGIIPGLLLAAIYSLIIVFMAHWTPKQVFEQDHVRDEFQDETLLSVLKKAAPIASLIILVLGGLYAGLFTPTEAGAVGAFGALIIALMRRRLSIGKFWSILVETGHVTVSVLFLVIGASFYSRMLALSGLPLELTNWLAVLDLGWIAFIFMYVALIVVMGCIIDSISIMLIVTPIAMPVVHYLGLDPIWFGVITVMAVEMGLITPPFGLSVFTVKSAVNDPRVTVQEIFKGSFPFLAGMFVCLVILIFIPSIVTWLPRNL